MTEKLKESLSAVIDDEADTFELRRVLDELDRNADMRALWDRYHLIGNAVRRRGAADTFPMPHLRERVWEALDAEAQDLPATGTGAGASRSLGRFTALAVAATVAFAVVIGLNGLGGGDDAPVTEVARAGASSEFGRSSLALPEVSGTDMTSTEAANTEISPSDLQRARAYMLHHAQQQALNQAGVMSMVKMATYEAP